MSLFDRNISLPYKETEQSFSDLFSEYSAHDQKLFIIACLEHMGKQHQLEVEQAVDEVAMIIVLREFQVNLTATVNMHVNVMAPDEEIAQEMVRHVGIEDLINGYGDGHEEVSINDVSIDIDDVDDIS